MAEFGEGFTVVEGEKKAVPRLGGEGAGEGGSGEGGVEMVVFGRVGEWGQKRDDVGGGGAEIGLGEGGRGRLKVGARGGGKGDAEFVPGGGAADEAADGLGVEEFVGENDAGAGEGEEFADAAGFERGKGVGRVGAEHAAVGLGADFDKDVSGGVESGGGEKTGGGGGDELAEEGAEAGGGVEIGGAVAGDAEAVAAVVADGFVVKGEAHEGVEAKGGRVAGGAAEGGDEIGRGRSGRIGRGSGRCHLQGLAHGHSARMFKRIITVLLGVMAGYLMTLGVVQVSQAWGLWPDREASRSAAQVREVLMLVNKHYVEEGEVAPDKLAVHAIDSMVGLLDPYSEFLSRDAFVRLEEDVGGEFGGVGVQIESVEDKLTVVAPIAGTPGERAGILRGDVIVAVDGESIVGITMEEAIRRLRGKPGTMVVVGVERGDPVVTKEFKIKREVIKVESVRDAEMIAPGIGYVRVAVFAERTGGDFAAALRELRAKGELRALVIDLRNNPGGLLLSAVEVVEPFFRSGDLVVYTEGRAKDSRMELRAKSRGEPLDIPIVVLVNGGSASASEIVAGALRDTDRAVLVGEKTFGKGSVQTVFPLRAGGGLRLTTARYFTPGGAVIHEKGIEPDVVEVMTPEQEKAVFLRRLRPDVTDAAEFEERFGVPPAEDTQLSVAVGLLAERLEAGK